jgi:hypothetical protein
LHKHLKIQRETIEKIESFFERNLWGNHDNPRKIINVGNKRKKYNPAENCYIQLILQYQMLTNVYDKATKRNIYQNICMLKKNHEHFESEQWPNISSRV